MHNMFDLTRKPKERVPHLQVVCLPDSCVMNAVNGAAKLLQKTEVSGFSEWLHLKERNTGVPGTTGTAGHRNMVQNSKASCCTLLKRITRLKCVNSEVRTVNIHPKKGCLQWLHGTMSEPPWKSH